VSDDTTIKVTVQLECTFSLRRDPPLSQTVTIHMTPPQHDVIIELAYWMASESN